MKKHSSLVLILAVLFGVACQSNDSMNPPAKTLPRTSLKVNDSGQEEIKTNSLLIQGKSSTKVAQDYDYASDADGILTVSQMIPVASNCETTPTVVMAWLQNGPNGQQMQSENVQANDTEIQVVTDGRYTLRVEVDNAKCDNFALTFTIHRQKGVLAPKPNPPQD